jgi:hypothetical protein
LPVSWAGLIRGCIWQVYTADLYGKSIWQLYMAGLFGGSKGAYLFKDGKQENIAKK